MAIIGMFFQACECVVVWARVVAASFLASSYFGALRERWFSDGAWAIFVGVRVAWSLGQAESTNSCSTCHRKSKLRDEQGSVSGGELDLNRYIYIV